MKTKQLGIQFSIYFIVFGLYILGGSGGVVNSLDFCPASLKSLKEMTLQPLTTSCVKDYKGHSLVQTSFTEPPNN